MKTSKKLLAFLLSTVMVLSLVVSVSVSANEGDLPYETVLIQNFADADSTKAVTGFKWSITDQTKIATSFVDDEDANDGKALKATIGSSCELTGDEKTWFITQSYYFKPNHRYRITIRAKGELNTNENYSSFRSYLLFDANAKYHDLGVSVTGAGSNKNQPAMIQGTLSGEYQEYTYEFALENDYAAKKTFRLMFFKDKTDGLVVGETAYIDYYQIEEIEPQYVGATFTIADGITVKSGSQVIENSKQAKEAYAGAGAPTEFSVECGEGKSAVVKVDGKKMVAGTGTFEFAISEDTETVSVEKLDIDGEIVLADFFNDGTVSGFTAGNGTLPVWKASEDEGTEGGVAYVTNKTDSTSGKKRLCNIGSGVTYEKGYEYTVSFKAKASVASATKVTGSVMFNTASTRGTVFHAKGSSTQYSASVYANPATFPDYATTWTDHEFSISIYDYIAYNKTDKVFEDATSVGSAFSGTFNLEPKGFTTSDWVMFDDLIVTRKPLDKVTVKVSGEGTVGAIMANPDSTSNAEVSRVANDGEVFYAHNNKKLAYFIEPAEGKVAVVNYNGAQEIITKKTKKWYLVNGDTTLDVTFVDATKTAAVEKTTMLRTADNAVYVYSIINQFNPALDANKNLNFGIKLWNAINTDGFVILNAKADNDGNDAVAQFGQAFVIKAYGEAITADNTYEAQAFVGTEYGEVVSTATATEEN